MDGQVPVIKTLACESIFIFFWNGNVTNHFKHFNNIYAKKVQTLMQLLYNCTFKSVKVQNTILKTILRTINIFLS